VTLALWSALKKHLSKADEDTERVLAERALEKVTAAATGGILRTEGVPAAASLIVLVDFAIRPSARGDKEPIL